MKISDFEFFTPSQRKHLKFSEKYNFGSKKLNFASKSSKNGNIGFGSFTVFLDIFLYGPVNRLVLVRFQNRNHQNVCKSICHLSSYKKVAPYKKEIWIPHKVFFMIFSAKKSFPPPIPPLTIMKIVFLVLGRKYLISRTKCWFRFWNRTKTNRLTGP